MSHSTLSFLFFGLALLGSMLAGILLVIFGKTTVKRLRKDPDTRDRLGIEIISGLNIISVAQALSLPKWVTQRSDKSPFGLLPNSELIYRKTTTFDRILGRLFYWTLMGSVALTFVWVIVLNMA
jgi:hypothetical protein